MRPLQLIPIFVLTATVVHAVTLRIHPKENCQGGYSVCTNIANGKCCQRKKLNPFGEGRPFRSVRFHHMTESEKGFLWTTDGLNPCGHKIKSIFGNEVCGERQGQELYGASVQACLTCAKRDVDGGLDHIFEREANLTDSACTGSVEPDLLVLKDGHMFDISPKTPDNVIESLYGYLDSDAVVSDIPSVLHQYEVDHAGVETRLV